MVTPNKDDKDSGMGAGDMNPFYQGGQNQGTGPNAKNGHGSRRRGGEQPDDKGKTYKRMLPAGLNSIYSSVFMPISTILKINISIHSTRITKI